MKTNITKISQEWQAMLACDTMPLFEISLVNGEYLIVDIELLAEKEEIRFSFDTYAKEVFFSGQIKYCNSCLFALPISEYDESLDELLQEIHSEVLEGFILPNGLCPTE